MAAEPKVYASIAAVMAELAREGVAKGRKNTQQGYNFRGIDDMYNALAPVLSKHKVIILPRVLSREVVERTTQKGGVLFYVTVEMEFDIVSGDDGSRHTVKTYGEAMDSADKATNKAMSAAFKYMVMQAFCIPTEGDHDADETTHEVAPRDADDVRACFVEIDKAEGPAALSAWGKANALRIRSLTDRGQAAVRGHYEAALARLRSAPVENDNPFDREAA